MAISPGTRLGRYEIRSPIGAGGMGEVYLADDTLLRRKVALKLLPADLAQNRERLGRFEQEAFTASALNHPNIVTVFEVGEADSQRFIATEFVDGETLRQRTAHTHVNVREALDVAIQVASALAAAHKAGVVHRDIKPENIMIRHDDGIVKVLDFGLAKATEKLAQPAIDPEAATRAQVNTSPGVVMGTAAYMSPEQARGLPVDDRTDIWSLGVVLYEMVAGHLPFEGQTASDVISMILQKEPPALTRLSDEATERLDEIVTKALAKNREERYQVAKDLLIDLRRLRQHLEVEAEIERTVPPNFRTSAVTSSGSGPQLGVPPSGGSLPPQGGTPSARMSSAEYIISEIKRHKSGFSLIGAGVLAVAIIVVASYLWISSRRAHALTEKDTIVLADFVNTTGDAVFDGTLKQGLAVQLGQSPFLNIFPDTRVRQTLRLMGRSPDDRVTKELAREICQRQGLKAFLAGSINNLGSAYVVTLEAVNGQSGEEIAREQVQAESKEQVLKVLSAAAGKMREKLGESLSSIQKFDAPLELTTSSLEALKAYSLGYEQSVRGKFLEAIPFDKRAVELDPNFAYAYAAMSVIYNNTNQPGLAAEYAGKAFALRDRVSELEKLRITLFYYAFSTGELDKQIEVLELYKQTYPRDYRVFGNLCDRYLTTGQFEKAAEAAREAFRLNPNTVVSYANLGQAFIGLNRFAEAREVFEQALQQKLDATLVRIGLYQIAFVSGDTATMQQQLDWAHGKPDEYEVLDSQTQTAAFAGQWRRSQELSNRAVDLAGRSNAKEVAARYAAEDAARGAVLGQCQQTKARTGQALSLERNTLSLTRSAMALALCGEAGQAQSLIDEIAKRYPVDTLINSIWLPVIHGAIELNRNNSAQAIQLLQAATRYEMGQAAGLWPAYIRGLAFLRQRAGTEAAAEFQEFLDHRGVVIVSPLYPLAQLGLARAAVLQGDTAKARKAYQDFFALWKDADPDIPILIEAKKEYELLK